jgi:photosystem II stability/assembly factor-like uncharacterized protein
MTESCPRFDADHINEGDTMGTRATFAAFLFALPAFAAGAPVTLQHVHGLAYGADGKRLVVASHEGLAIFDDHGWSMAPGMRYDFMGFSATHSYFYSSGHPAPGSGAVNPLGLIRTSDGGAKWDKLGLEGQADFHLLATGYATNAIYVYSGEPNPRMKSPGLYATLNDGFAWRRAEAQGLEGKLAALAVHPTAAKTVAVATTAGLFLSTDGGERFERVASKGQTLAAYFSHDGRQLWFATHDGKPHLFRMDLAKRTMTEVALPPLTMDAVAYIAQSPTAPSTYAIATFERNVYVTTDSGTEWRQIAAHGQTNG